MSTERTVDLGSWHRHGHHLCHVLRRFPVDCLAVLLFEFDTGLERVAVEQFLAWR